MTIKYETKQHLKISICSPAVQLNPISKFGELVGQPPLLDNPLWADRHLTEGVGFRCCHEAKLVDSVGDDVLGRGVFADDDVAALLVCFEHPDNLVWDVLKAEARWKKGSNQT